MHLYAWVVYYHGFGASFYSNSKCTSLRRVERIEKCANKFLPKKKRWSSVEFNKACNVKCYCKTPAIFNIRNITSKVAESNKSQLSCDDLGFDESLSVQFRSSKLNIHHNMHMQKRIFLKKRLAVTHPYKSPHSLLLMLSKGKATYFGQYSFALESSQSLLSGH